MTKPKIMGALKIIYIKIKFIYILKFIFIYNQNYSSLPPLKRHFQKYFLH